MISEKSQKLENKKSEQNVKNFKKIGARFQGYQKLLAKWIIIYVLIYISWSLLSYFLISSKGFKNFFNYGRGSRIFVAFAVSLCRGVLFSLDGIITSRLKAPFGQICYSINKSEEVSEKHKDKIIEKITESNEHCKETFKKFGVLTIANEMRKILSQLNKDKHQSVKKDPQDWDFYLDIIEYSIAPLMCYIVPLILAWDAVSKINKELGKVWNLINLPMVQTTKKPALSV